jgi:hypothetical protein
VSVVEYYRRSVVAAKKRGALIRGHTDADLKQPSKDHVRKGGVTMRRFEYQVIDTGRDIEAQLNGLGAEGWQVVGVTTKKQLLIAPPP